MFAETGWCACEDWENEADQAAKFGCFRRLNQSQDIPKRNDFMPVPDSSSAYYQRICIFLEERFEHLTNYILPGEDTTAYMIQARSGTAWRLRKNPSDIGLAASLYDLERLMESLCNILLASTFVPDVLRRNMETFGRFAPSEKKSQP